MNPSNSSTRIKALLSRFGREVTIERISEGSSDRLNHPTGTYGVVGTETCAFYNPDTKSGQTGSGELSITTPHFAFPPDATIIVNDHIIYDGTTYEVEKVTNRPSHSVAIAKEV